LILKEILKGFMSLDKLGWKF